MRKAARHVSTKDSKCRAWLPINITIITRCSSLITTRTIWSRLTPSLRMMSSASPARFQTLVLRTASVLDLLAECTLQGRCSATTIKASTSLMRFHQTTGNQCTKQVWSWLKGLHKKSWWTQSFPRQCTLSSYTRCQFGQTSSQHKLMRVAHPKALRAVPQMILVTPRNKTTTLVPLDVLRER